jgi:hypothetical protein
MMATRRLGLIPVLPCLAACGLVNDLTGKKDSGVAMMSFADAAAAQPDAAAMPADAGPTPTGSGIGDPCHGSAECTSGQICITTYPSGACAQPFSGTCASGPCPSGSTCLQLTPDQGFCMPSCSDTLACPRGGVCYPRGPGGSGACEPPCTSNSDCTGGICDLPSGRCVVELPDAGVSIDGGLSAMVTPQNGGRIESGGLVVDVPPGAVSTPVTISAMLSNEAPPANVALATAIYRFSPAGLTFLMPVRVEIPVTAAATAPVLYWTTPDGSQFQPIAGSGLVSGSVVGEVTHFSGGFGGAATAAALCPSVTLPTSIRCVWMDATMTVNNNGSCCLENDTHQSAIAGTLDSLGHCTPPSGPSPLDQTCGPTGGDTMHCQFPEGAIDCPAMWLATSAQAQTPSVYLAGCCGDEHWVDSAMNPVALPYCGVPAMDWSCEPIALQTGWASITAAARNDPPACTPSCGGQNCGQADGCGGTCLGSCPTHFSCIRSGPGSAPYYCAALCNADSDCCATEPSATAVMSGQYCCIPFNGQNVCGSDVNFTCPTYSTNLCP